MKIAIISDVHSNLEALKKVLKDIKSCEVDEVYCLGDIVGYGPEPGECLDEVRGVAGKIVKGNHEEYLFKIGLAEVEVNKYAFAGLRYSLDNLSGSDLKFLESLPARIVDQELNLSLAHGSFSLPCTQEYIEDWKDAEMETRVVPTHLCFIGHTHEPRIFCEGRINVQAFEDYALSSPKKYIINVGSVGQPRDRDCRASYGVLTITEEGASYALRRVEYNIKKAKVKFLKAGLPELLADRLFSGR